MFAIGLSLLIGILVFVVVFTATDQEIIITSFLTVLMIIIAFVLISLRFVQVPNEPEDLELVSSSEVEIIYTQGQYWIYNSDDKEFIPLFDKDLQSYVVYEKGLEYPKVYKEKYKKPNLWYITPFNLHDYTYYKIVMAE